MRFYLYRMFRQIAQLIGRVLPESSFRNAVLSGFYFLLNGIPLGFETFTFFDGTKAKFYRFLSMPSAVPGAGHEIELYVADHPLQEGEVVVDAGACPGDFAIYAAKKVGKQGRVICFEPNPYGRMILVRNIRLNRLHNIEVVPQAVWSSAGRTQFGVAGKYSRVSDLEMQTDHERTSFLQVSVTLTTIDDAVQRAGIDKVDFVKMDVEGAEIAALEGCRQIMEHSDVHFAISSHHLLADGSESYGHLGSTFERLGYSAHTEDGKVTFASRSTVAIA